MNLRLKKDKKITKLRLDLNGYPVQDIFDTNKFLHKSKTTRKFVMYVSIFSL